MAKWRRGGGGRRGRGRWVIEYVPDNRYTSSSTGAVIHDGEAPMVNEEEPTPEALTPGVKGTEPDPFEHDDPYQIRNALAAMENDQPTENSDAVN